MKSLIEIKKNADGKQAVSAREMYLALGLKSANWQRWATKNIEKNYFAVDGVDWVLMEGSGNSSLGRVKKGNIAKDYVLTLDFAKKLSMQARTEKGEQVRNYFIEVERKAQELSFNTIDVKKITELENKVLRLEAKAVSSEVNEFSVHGYAGLCNVRITINEASSLGKLATKKCKELNVTISKLRDPRFGFVNLYPESVLKDVFTEFFKNPRF